METAKHLSCTADLPELAAIAQVLARLGEHAKHPPVRTTDGYLIVLPRSPALYQTVQEFIRRDSACCSFLRFEVTANEEEITLHVSGPAESQALLDQCISQAKLGYHESQK